MKKEVSKDQASRLINPGMIIGVTVGNLDKATITPCAWHLPVSKNPSLLAVALAKKHFSSELIKISKEFIVNIPQWSLLDKLIACGRCSGRDIDKFAKIQLTRALAVKLKQTPAIAECVGHIECELFEAKEIGDHLLFVGNIIYAEVESEYFKEGFWDTNGVELIFHLGAKYFFKSSPYIEVKQ